MARILTAEQAAEDYENGTLPGHAIVQDSAANIATFLDTLEQIARAGKLEAIEITGNTPLAVDATQVHDDAKALSRIKGGYQLAVTDTAADILAALPDLEKSALHGHIQSVAIAGSGSHILNLTATQVDHALAVLLKVSGKMNEAVADNHAAISGYLDQLEKLAEANKLASIEITNGSVLTITATQVHRDAKALADISGPYQLAVKDSSSNVSAALTWLESAAKSGTLQKIVLTDTSPISLTEKQLASDAGALAKISGAYTLSVTNVLAAQAMTVAGNAHVASLFINDSAANVAKYLPQLEALTGAPHSDLAGLHPDSGVLGGITLTDTGTPTFSLTESDLNGAEDVLNLIQSPFILNVTGVLASDVGSLAGNPLIDVLSVLDSAANVAAHLGTLESVNAAGKIGTVTLTSGTLATSDTSDAAFGLYAHFAGADGIAIDLSGAYSDPNGATGLFGQFLESGPAGLGITVPVGIVEPFGGLIQRTFLFQLQHAADNGYLASFSMGSHLDVENLSTGDLLLLDNTTIIDAIFASANFFDYTASSLTAAQAAQYFASAVSVAVENSAALLFPNSTPVGDATMISAIVDSAADLQANLDAIATALGARPLAVPIQLTDDLPPTISVSVAQATADATVLNAIASTFLLSINGSASALNSIDLSGLTNEKIELSFTNLNHNVTIEGGNILDVNLAHLLVANDIITVKAYSSGGQNGTEIDLTGTDGLAHTIILIGVDPAALTVYTPFDTGTALGAHGTQVTGGISVADALGGSGSVAITDTAANVQANLDALEAIHDRITGIGFSNATAPTLSLSEAQLSADNDVLGLFSGNYHLALTGVAAADAAALAASTDVSSVAIVDSAADIEAALDALEHIAKAGKLAGVALSDSGTPAMTLSAARLFADQDVLSAITSSYGLNVTGVLASDVGSLAGNPLIDVLSVLDSAANVAAHLGTLESVNAAGKIGTVTLTSGTLATSDTSDAAFGLYAHFAGADGIAIDLSGAYSDPNGATGLFGQFLESGPAGLGITVPVGIVEPFGGLIQRTFLFQLQHAADNGYLASFSMGSHLDVENLSTGDLLLLDNTTIIDAIFASANFFDYTASSLTAAQAAQYFASAVSVAVENSAALLFPNSTPVGDATMISAIVDSAADLQANLDAIATALGARPLAVPIQLTDDLPPTISVSVAQATADATVLNAIASTFLLSINGSASALNSIDLSGLTNEKIELSFTNLNHNVTIEGGNILDVNLAHLLVANDIITVKAYSSGGQNGTEIDLTGTDGLAHTIILIGVDPAALTVYTPFDTGTALGAHGTQVTGGISVADALGGSGSVAITDTAANVQANLDALEAIHDRITGIGFSNATAPTLSLSEAQLSADNDVLGLFSGNYHLALTGVAAADAAALAASTDVSSVAIVDSAADIEAALDALEHIAKAGKLAGVALSDSGTPAMTLSAARLFADQDVLSAITSSYGLNVTGVLASDVGSLAGNPLIDVLSVLDSAANVAAHLGTLESVNAAGKIGTVTLTSGTLATSDTSDAAFGLYAHFAGADGIAIDLSGAYSDPNGATGLFGQFLESGPAGLGITVPVGIVEPFGGLIQRTFLFQLQHAADNGYLASFSMGSHLDVENLSTGDLLLLDNTTIIDAIFASANFFDYTASSLTAAQAAQYFASAVSVAVENSAALLFPNSTPVGDATMISAIVDSAADLQANLDAIATALGARPLAVPIQLTDDLPPTISVSVAQATADATVLNAIASTFLLSINGSAEQLDGLALSTPANAQVELAVTSLDHDITVSGNHIFDVDLAKLAIVNDTVTVKAYSSGGQNGTEIDLTGTDGDTHKIILIGVDPGSLNVYTPVDSGIDLGAHGPQITGGLTVAAALAGSGAEAVSDTAANVSANLDALESIAGRLTGIGFTDSGTPTVMMSEQQLTTDHDLLGLFSGNYTLGLSNVAAADAFSFAANPDVSALYVTDTGADIAAELDQLEHIFKLGKLDGVSITSGDLGTLTETQLLADSDVLKLIGTDPHHFI